MREKSKKMAARKIREGVFSVGAVDWDRTMFDALIPLPDGTSYNSYVVVGSEKTVLIDTVDETKSGELIGNLKDAGIDKIDFIISNHAEQDHSGSLKRVLKEYPEARIVTNARCKEFLQDMYCLEDGLFIVIKDGDALSLGNKTLQFVLAPWVHWPETMLTFLKEDGILFTCDLFGSHLATSRLYAENKHEVHLAAKRYYAEIMMPFRKNIQNHLRRVRELGPGIIAPGHGPVYDDPDFILDLYSGWVSDSVENEVLIAYVSMHDTTRRMAFFLGNELMKRGIDVNLFNLEHPDIGGLAMASVDAATIVIGSPTVLTGSHPNAAYAALLLNELRPKARFLAVIGSYGWAGRMAEQLKSAMNHMGVEFVGEVIAKKHSEEEMFAPLSELAHNIAQKHREIELKAGNENEN